MEDPPSGMTTMLDLIFNILAYFVVTFNPPKPERNFDIYLPPPKVEDESQSQDTFELPEEEDLLDEIQITLGAGPSGSLASVRLQGREIPGGIRALPNELSLSVGAEKGVGKSIEAATIISSPKLKYKWVIQVVDACYRAGIVKINFAQAAGP